MDAITIDQKLIPSLLQLPSHRVWIDYDEKGDILYLSFEKPWRATDSVMKEDGNVYHYRGERVVGATILHASARDYRITAISGQEQDWPISFPMHPGKGVAA